jgi:hypothetical protein
MGQDCAELWATTPTVGHPPSAERFDTILLKRPRRAPNESRVRIDGREPMTSMVANR